MRPLLVSLFLRVLGRPSCWHADQTSMLLSLFYSAEQDGWGIECTSLAGYPALSWGGTQACPEVSAILLAQDGQRRPRRGAGPFFFFGSPSWRPHQHDEPNLPTLGVLLGPAALAAPSCAA